MDLLTFFAVFVGSGVAVVWGIGSLVTRQRRRKLFERYHDAALVDKLMRHEVWAGMTEGQLVDSLGSPIETDTTLLKTKKSEAFKYQQTGKNRFDLRVFLENGIVVGWKKKE